MSNVAKTLYFVLMSVSLGKLSATADANAAGERVASAEEVLRVVRLSNDLAYGEYLATECIACHSKDPGIDVNIPMIYGLPPEAIVWAMLEYGSGYRGNTTMRNVVDALGDEDISAIAQYLESVTE